MRNVLQKLNSSRVSFSFSLWSVWYTIIITKPYQEKNMNTPHLNVNHWRIISYILLLKNLRFRKHHLIFMLQTLYKDNYVHTHTHTLMIINFSTFSCMCRNFMWTNVLIVYESPKFNSLSKQECNKISILFSSSIYNLIISIHWTLYQSCIIKYNEKWQSLDSGGSLPKFFKLMLNYL